MKDETEDWLGGVASFGNLGPGLERTNVFARGPIDKP